MLGQLNQGASQETQDIGTSVVPLIDVMMVLLIFFIVATSFVQDMSLDLNRPQASTAVSASPEAIRLYLDANGKTYVGGHEVQPWVLQTELGELLDSSGSNRVLVVTDGSVPSQQLVWAVDQARMAGAGQVGVATEADTGGA